MLNMIKALIFSSMELTFNILLIFVNFILFIVLFANIVLFLCWVLLTYRANRSGDLGRYDQGIVAAKQALKLSQFFGIFKKNYGLFGIFEKNNSYEANSLSNLALLYRHQGRYSEAEALYKQAIKIGKISLPANHRSLATYLHSLAVLYHYQGRYSEAEPLSLIHISEPTRP